MTQTQRLLLAHKQDVGHIGDAQTLLQHLFLAGLCQFFFQLGAAVKMILNNALVAAQNDQDIGNTGTDGLLHQILDGGLIHDGQHSLGHRLGGGQYTGAKTCSRNNGFGDFFHDDSPIFSFYARRTALFSRIPILHEPLSDKGAYQCVQIRPQQHGAKAAY